MSNETQRKITPSIITEDGELRESDESFTTAPLESRTVTGPLKRKGKPRALATPQTILEALNSPDPEVQAVAKTMSAIVEGKEDELLTYASDRRKALIDKRLFYYSLLPLLMTYIAINRNIGNIEQLDQMQRISIAYTFATLYFLLQRGKDNPNTNAMIADLQKNGSAIDVSMTLFARPALLGKPNLDKNIEQLGRYNVRKSGGVRRLTQPEDASDEPDDDMEE